MKNFNLKKYFILIGLIVSVFLTSFINPVTAQQTTNLFTISVEFKTAGEAYGALVLIQNNKPLAEYSDSIFPLKMVVSSDSSFGQDRHESLVVWKKDFTNNKTFRTVNDLDKDNAGLYWVRLEDKNGAVISNTTGPCTVLSATFSPSGVQPAGWYKKAREAKSKDDPNLVRVKIQTQNCEGKDLEVSITERDLLLINEDIGELNNKALLVDQNGLIEFTSVPGETKCDSDESPNCHYFLSIYKTASGATAYYDSLNEPGNPKGELSYNCDGFCIQDDWVIADLLDAYFTGQQVVEQPNPTGLQETGDYELLADLPFFGTTFNIKDGLTPYLRVIFQLLIGLAGLLSVIMIVIGGIEYMSTDAMSGKEEGRERVTQAIFGLIIALGAWLLLNTINPNLLSLKINMANQPTPTGGVSTPPPTGGGDLTYEAVKGTCVHINKITIAHFFESSSNFTSTHPEVQKNLDALKKSFDELRAQVLADHGIALKSSSAYRTRTYQRHFYEIFNLYNELVVKNNTETNCAALREWVRNEKEGTREEGGHSILSTVAKADEGCNGPHTLGTSIDLGPSSRIDDIVKSAIKIATIKYPKQEPFLRQGNQKVDSGKEITGEPIPGDIVHFSLISAPVGCPKEPLP